MAWGRDELAIACAEEVSVKGHGPHCPVAGARAKQVRATGGGIKQVSVVCKPLTFSGWQCTVVSYLGRAGHNQRF